MVERSAAESILPHPASVVCAWHARPGALERLTPPWRTVQVLSHRGIAAGSATEVVLRQGPLRLAWSGVHEALEHGFRDVQRRGPFRTWMHDHVFEPHPGGTRVVDRATWSLPTHFAPARPFVGREIARTFAWRHGRLARDLARHAEVAAPASRVAVTGASGLVGGELVPFLTTGGHDVARVARGALPPEDADAVVHLAGENISARRWTRAQRERILLSRIDGTRRIAKDLAARDRPPRVLVVASAVGFHGDAGEATVDETSLPGDGFLADVCRAWEDAASPAQEAGIRVVNARFGVVLSARGGMLPRILPPARLGLGGPIGHGRQWVSWVGIEDAVAAIHRCLFDDRLSGPVEVVAGAVRQRDLASILGRILGRPAFAPLPAAVVRAAFGALGEELLLGGQRVVPRRLPDAGFRFETDLGTVLGRELGRLGPRTCPVRAPDGREGVQDPSRPAIGR